MTRAREELAIIPGPLTTSHAHDPRVRGAREFVNRRTGLPVS